MVYFTHMVKEKIALVKKEITLFLDFHNPVNTKKYIIFASIVLVALAVMVRKSFIGFGNADYDIFAGWYDYVDAHGIMSFNTDFSNYNPPYTYFLYLITILPIEKMLAIKGLMFVFDILLAVSIFYVVRHFKKGLFVPLAAAVGSLFLPAVIATGVLWGQFDQFYTAFILFSLWALLKDKSKLAWIFFGVAIAIKLQAIFFLPVLLLMSFKRIKIWDAVYGVGIFLVLTFLPMLAGRSFSSIVNIYVAQTGLFHGNLTLNTANIYQWVPASAFEFFNSAGIYFTMAVMIGFFIYNLVKRKFDDGTVMLLSTIMLFLIPFLLPQMHERYVFSATILAYVLAVVNVRYVWAAIVMQFIVLFSYIPFLFHQEPPLGFPILALIALGLNLFLIKEYIEKNNPGILKRALRKLKTH